MNNNKTHAVLMLALVVMSLPNITLALSETDFAYSAELRTDGHTPFYELEIPEQVYKNVNRSDLGDIRVLNAAGEVVPHGLRDIAPENFSQAQTASVPYFPLYQKEGETSGELHLNIQRSAAGEIIDIQSSAATHAQTDRLTGYVLDMREWQQAVDTITFSWNAPENTSFIRKLNILASNDLSNWQLISAHKTLVNLSFQNHRLIENTIKLATGQHKYLRVLFSDQKPGLEISRIEVSNTQSSQQQKQNWQQITVSKTETPGEYSFQNQLNTLPKSLRVQLPENNTVVKASVVSRNSPDKPWQHRGSSLLYRLSVDGIDIQHTNIPLIPSRDTDWAIQIDQQGGGIGSGLPKVELAWQPQQLVFVARGKAPYKLVWGSARVAPVTQNASQILVSVNQANHASMLATAYWLAETVRPVNMQSLVAETQPVNWRHWLLWSILIASALLLIWMAVRLMGKMKT